MPSAVSCLHCKILREYIGLKRFVRDWYCMLSKFQEGSTESTDVKKPRQQAGQGRTQTKAHANLPFGNRKARNTNQDEEIGVKKEKQRK